MFYTNTINLYFYFYKICICIKIQTCTIELTGMLLSDSTLKISYTIAENFVTLHVMEGLLSERKIHLKQPGKLHIIEKIKVLQVTLWSEQYRNTCSIASTCPSQQRHNILRGKTYYIFYLVELRGKHNSKVKQRFINGRASW